MMKYVTSSEHDADDGNDNIQYNTIFLFCHIFNIYRNFIWFNRKEKLNGEET